MEDEARAGREPAGAFVSAGLFNYPILMAADVLAYRATEVPVGDDQRQHVELTREIARRFNERFGATLVVPEHRIPDGRRPDHGPPGPDEQDVDDGRQRAGTVYVLDEPDADPQEVQQRRHRLRPRGPPGRARGGKEGIENLIEILCVARGIEPEEVEAEFEGNGYGDFKAAVGDAVVEFLAPVRERYAELREDPTELERILAFGADKARALAAPVLADVRDAMGVAEPR